MGVQAVLERRLGAGSVEALLLQYEVEQFFYHESSLLDDRRFTEWLGLMADDLTYFMPVRSTRAPGDEANEFSTFGQGAFFDDDKPLLVHRVNKLLTGFAWAEEPHSRTRHMVSNVRIIEHLPGDEIRTKSNIALYRSRLEKEEDLWFGERIDRLRRAGDSWLIVDRIINLDLTMLKSQNISVLF